MLDLTVFVQRNAVDFVSVGKYFCPYFSRTFGSFCARQDASYSLRPFVINTTSVTVNSFRIIQLPVFFREVLHTAFHSFSASSMYMLRSVCNTISRSAVVYHG